MWTKAERRRGQAPKAFSRRDRGLRGVLQATRRLDIGKVVRRRYGGPPVAPSVHLRSAGSTLPCHRTPAVATASGGSSPLTRLRKDRKSTRLNSSHVAISYAVFCLKK